MPNLLKILPKLDQKDVAAINDWLMVFHYNDLKIRDRYHEAKRRPLKDSYADLGLLKIDHLKEVAIFYLKWHNYYHWGRSVHFPTAKKLFKVREEEQIT